MKIIIRALGLILLLTLSALPAWAGQNVGSSPYTADLLVSGLNTGTLNPGQEYWYAYSRMDLGDSSYNSIVLSLNFEAEGRAVASRVNFQVFNFEQVDSWLKDNSGPLDSLGLGTPASADFDAITGERLWAGPVGSTEVYYVRIFNLSPSPVRFRLTAVGQKSAQMDAFMAVDKIVMPGSDAAPVIPAAVSKPVEAAASPELVEPVVPVSAMLRYVHVLFPGLIILAHWGRSRTVDSLITTTFLLLLGLLTALFVRSWNVPGVS